MTATPFATVNIGLGTSILGWIIMAFAIRHPAMQLDPAELGTLIAGFGVHIGGIGLMLWGER